MYFKLNEEFILNKDSSGCIVYNLLNGKKYIFNSIQTDIILDLEDNVTIEELYSNYDATMINGLLNYLVKEDIGMKYDHKCVISKLKYIPKLILEDTKNILPFLLNSATIELTGECNLNCIFCTSDKEIYRSCGCKIWQYDLTIDDSVWIDIINQLIALGVKQIVFSGGEPLLKLDLLIDIIFILKKHNINIIIYTNGTLINQLFIDAVKNYDKITLIVQVLSSNNETYKNITGEGRLFEVIKNNLFSLDANKINYIIQFLIGSFNELELNDMKSYFSDNKKMTSYIYPTNSYSGLLNKTQKKMIDFKEKSITITLYNYQQQQKYNSCLSNNIFVSASGDIFPCMMLRDFKLGSIMDYPLYEIFRGKEYKKYWQIPKNGVDNCEECKYNLQCIDCRALEYYATKKLNGMVYCDKIK